MLLDLEQQQDGSGLPQRMSIVKECCNLYQNMNTNVEARHIYECLDLNINGCVCGTLGSVVASVLNTYLYWLPAISVVMGTTYDTGYDTG